MSPIDQFCVIHTNKTTMMSKIIIVLVLSFSLTTSLHADDTNDEYYVIAPTAVIVPEGRILLVQKEESYCAI